MATIFFQLLTQFTFENDLHAFNLNSSYILLHYFSIAVLSEPIFGWEVALILFSKTPQIAKSMVWI